MKTSLVLLVITLILSVYKVSPVKSESRRHIPRCGPCKEIKISYSCPVRRRGRIRTIRGNQCRDCDSCEDIQYCPKLRCYFSPTCRLFKRAPVIKREGLPDCAGCPTCRRWMQRKCSYKDPCITRECTRCPVIKQSPTCPMIESGKPILQDGEWCFDCNKCISYCPRLECKPVRPTCKHLEEHPLQLAGRAWCVGCPKCRDKFMHKCSKLNCPNVTCQNPETEWELTKPRRKIYICPACPRCATGCPSFKCKAPECKDYYFQWYQLGREKWCRGCPKCPGKITPKQTTVHPLVTLYTKYDGKDYTSDGTASEYITGGTTRSYTTEPQLKEHYEPDPMEFING